MDKQENLKEVLWKLDEELATVNKKLLTIKGDVAKYNLYRNIAEEREKFAVALLKEETDKITKVDERKEKLENEIALLNANASVLNDEIKNTEKYAQNMSEWSEKLQFSSPDILAEKFTNLLSAMKTLEVHSSAQQDKAVTLINEINAHRGVNRERERITEENEQFEKILTELRLERAELDEKLNTIYDKLRLTSKNDLE